MMASSNPRRIATYDVTLDTEDDQVKIVTELANFHSVVIFCELKGIYNFFLLPRRPIMTRTIKVFQMFSLFGEIFDAIPMLALMMKKNRFCSSPKSD